MGMKFVFAPLAVAESPIKRVTINRVTACLMALALALPAGAAAPNRDPQVDWARTADPQIELGETRLELPEGLAELWLKALQHPESDLRRQAADSITAAHPYGLPVSDQLIEALVNVLETPDEHPVAVTAAARALVTIDAQQAAPRLLESARRGPIELRRAVEPGLARWDFEPARALWLERLAEPGTPPAALHLAMECLADVAEPRAIPALTQLATAPTISATTRLAAAKALAKLPADDLTDIARRLAEDSSPVSLISRLVGVHLLAEQSDAASLDLLDQYALGPEPTVMAQAIERLLQVAPERVVERAEATLGHDDSRVRWLTVKALATAPSEPTITALVSVLSDRVPEIRYDARRILLDMSAKDDLRKAVIDGAMQTLAADSWRGIEQSILILTELDQEQAGQPMLQLLRHSRPEVFVSAAWGLKKLSVSDLLDPMLDEAQRIAEEIASGPAPFEASLALAHLLEAMGAMGHRPAEPFLRTFIPKSVPHTVDVRSAAIWSLGFLAEDPPDPQLVEQLEDRLADAASVPPEYFEVRAMAAVSLGRMGAESALPTLREFNPPDGTDSELGRSCGWAIEQLTGEPLGPPRPQTRQLRRWFLTPIPN